MLKHLAMTAALTALCATTAHAGEASDVLRAHLENGTLAQGETALAQMAAANPRDQEARYALGTAQFARAFETFGQTMHRHGLSGPSLQRGAPALLRLPVPPNANPEPLSYEQFRAALETFAADLDEATLTLSGVDNARVKLRIDLAAVRLDLNADGAPDAPGDFEAFLSDEPPAAVEETPIPDGKPSRAAPQSPPAPPSREIAFDRADALWMQGYANVFAAQADFILAHDFSEMFNATFHVLFPGAGLPMQALERSDPDAPMIGRSTGFADAIAAIHTLNWPVIDRARRANVRTRLLRVTALSRETWTQIRRERDNDHEWLPNPRQTAPFQSLQVTDPIIAGWMDALDLADAVLNGEKLVPHWRFEQGVDVRAFLESDANFDPVALATGYGAVPFLRDGEKVTAEEMNRISEQFGGDFLLTAAWFN
ncbi:MAG: hypothetical protein GC189_08785 [Alphaproteobacteria bacterium]|nr:hypothetical protein [Alphaproteobacteria bacterium]